MSEEYLRVKLEAGAPCELGREAIDTVLEVLRQRDANRERADALAAHVQRLKEAEAAHQWDEDRLSAMIQVLEEDPDTSLARRDAEQQARALRAFAQEQQDALESLPARDRYEVHRGRSVDNWHNIFAYRAEDMADRISRQTQEDA